MARQTDFLAASFVGKTFLFFADFQSDAMKLAMMCVL